jgi:hypothetical protein
VSLTDDQAYATAVEDFEGLRKILPKFRQHEAWLRSADYYSHRIRNHLAPGLEIATGVQRDYAVCALANKGCNTHASVRLLTDAGDGDDAMVLTRVLLETAVIFRWIMLDIPYRLDLYCLSTVLFKRRWTQLVQQHFSNEPDVIAKARLTAEETAVADAAFGNTTYKWARERQPNGKFSDYSFDLMLKEIEKAEANLSNAGFMYDVTYFMHSAHAHATAEGIRQFKTLGRQKFFTAELGFNSGECAMALGSANTFLCWLLGEVSRYLGLRDVEAELDKWFDKMRARQKTQASPATGTT